MQPPAPDAALLVGEDRDAFPAPRLVPRRARGTKELAWVVPICLAGREERVPLPSNLPQHLLGGLRRERLVRGRPTEHKVQVIVGQHGLEVKELLPDVKIREVVEVLRPVAEE